MCGAQGGVLRNPDPGRWVRVDQLASAMFHRDHPVGDFRGQAPYLRLAALRLGVVTGH